jgi:hypothetical protein
LSQSAGLSVFVQQESRHSSLRSSSTCSFPDYHFNFIIKTLFTHHLADNMSKKHSSMLYENSMLTSVLTCINDPVPDALISNIANICPSR